MSNNERTTGAAAGALRHRFLSPLFPESGLFLLILLIEAGLLVFLTLDRRVIGGHDGFQYFYLQYYFLNHVVNYGEIPQWMPFLTHGSVATWWHFIQGGIVQNVLLLSGGLLRGINFLPVFYVGILVDKLLLLTGVWLLARRFYRSPVTVFFVSLTIMGSCVWPLQLWWNFHFYYALPLMLYFLHLFLDNGRWRYYFLAGNLLFLQSLGNLPYYLPVTSLIIFLYFLFYFLVQPREALRKIRNIDHRWYVVPVTVLIGGFFLVLYFFTGFGTEQLINYNFRSPDSSSALNIFLQYSGQLRWEAVLELISGVSPALDYTIYAGICCVPLLLSAVALNLNKRNLPLLLTMVVLVLFSMGTCISVFFYYCWPLMPYFRHLGLMLPVIKIFFCFLAGFGFEALWLYQTRSRSGGLVSRVVYLGLALVLVGIFFLLRSAAGNYPDNFGFFVDLVERVVPRYLPVFLSVFYENGSLPLLLGRTALLALAAAVIFAAVAVAKQSRYLGALIFLLLVLHGADLYSYKFSQLRFMTISVPDQLYEVTRFQKMPYPKRRHLRLTDNLRTELLAELPIQYGAFYWSTHAFLFQDLLGSPFDTSSWLQPLDQYMKAYWGQPYDDSDIEPRGFAYYSHLNFPRSHPAAMKISGVTKDKIQFFSNARMVATDDDIVARITDERYTGDKIFLSSLSPKQPALLSQTDEAKENLASSDRIRLPYQVQHFDSNNLVITTSVNDLNEAWLMYSDVWHPFWRARVNGRQVPVYKANLAYKGVKLEKGFNKIHFYFQSRLMSIAALFFGLNALFWVGGILGLTGSLLLRRSKGSVTDSDQKGLH